MASSAVTADVDATTAASPGRLYRLNMLVALDLSGALVLRAESLRLQEPVRIGHRYSTLYRDCLGEKTPGTGV